MFASFAISDAGISGNLLAHQTLIFPASPAKSLVRWKFQKAGPVCMHFASSNCFVACLVLTGHSLLALPDSLGRPLSPTPALHRAQEREQPEEEARLREAFKRAPNDPSYPARLGSLLLAQNRLREAALFFEKALKLDQRNIDIRRDLAATYWQLGKLEDARKNLESVVKARPGDTWGILLLGMVLEDLGDHQRAARLLSEVLPLVRQRPETIAALARANYSIGEREKARAALQLLVGHPAGPEAVFQGGRLAAEFKDYETTEKLLSSVKDTYPDSAALNYNIALAQFGAKHYQESEKTLTASIGYGHGTADAYALLGWTYAKQDRLPEMLQAFEKAINMEPSNPVHFLDLGDALLEKMNYGTALAVANETVKRFPSISRAYSLKGSVELKMYLLTEALKSYATAVDLDPNDPKAALGLALTQWNANQNEEAARSFEEGARKFPRDAFFLMKHAIFLLNSSDERNAQREARIRVLLKRSEELDDSIAETHFQLGNLAMKGNNYEEALNELRIAAKLDPELPKVHFALARLYRRAGRLEEAEKETEIHRKLKEKDEQNAEVNSAIGTRHP